MKGKGRPASKKPRAKQATSKKGTRAKTSVEPFSKTRIKMAVRKKPTGGVLNRIDEIRKVIAKYGGSIEGIVDTGTVDNSFNASEFENFIQWVGFDPVKRDPLPEIK